MKSQTRDDIPVRFRPQDLLTWCNGKERCDMNNNAYMIMAAAMAAIAGTGCATYVRGYGSTHYDYYAAEPVFHAEPVTYVEPPVIATVVEPTYVTVTETRYVTPPPPPRHHIKHYNTHHGKKHDKHRDDRHIAVGRPQPNPCAVVAPKPRAQAKPVAKPIAKPRAQAKPAAKPKPQAKPAAKPMPRTADRRRK